MSEVDTGMLYAALDAARAARDLSWRDVAEQTRISASTFSRMAPGHGQQPSLDAYVVLCRWLGMPMDTFTPRGREHGSMTLDSELCALLHRHGVDGPEREFLLSAYRALSTWRTRKAAA